MPPGRQITGEASRWSPGPVCPAFRPVWPRRAESEGMRTKPRLPQAVAAWKHGVDFLFPAVDKKTNGFGPERRRSPTRCRFRRLTRRRPVSWLLAHPRTREPPHVRKGSSFECGSGRCKSPRGHHLHQHGQREVGLAVQIPARAPPALFRRNLRSRGWGGRLRQGSAGERLN